MSKSIGRPTGFDRDSALRCAVILFWEHGYGATSLPQLLAAMGIARSSFYAAFGSKHSVMLEALDQYTHELYAEMEEAAARETEPLRALVAALEVAACTKSPAHGCLFLNMATELVPQDAEVRLKARRHLDRVDGLLRRLLSKLGHSSAACAAKSAALLALATGSVALRKAGETDKWLRSLLQEIAVLARTAVDV